MHLILNEFMRFDICPRSRMINGCLRKLNFSALIESVKFDNLRTKRMSLKQINRLDRYNGIRSSNYTSAG